jgi:hypothetical protein
LFSEYCFRTPDLELFINRLPYISTSKYGIDKNKVFIFSRESPKALYATQDAGGGAESGKRSWVVEWVKMMAVDLSARIRRGPILDPAPKESLDASHKACFRSPHG